MSDASVGITAIATHNLSKRYGRDVALDDVNLHVPEGAVYVLLGTNGSGKSTTLKVLLNLESPDSGSAEIFGMNTVRRGPDVRAQIGYVPEKHDAGYRWMTCERLLQHVSKYFPSWDDDYMHKLIRAFELRITRKVGALSKGDARRLQLILALAHRPPVLLLDEPTDGLDPIVRRRTLELLAEHLADTPTTVLISTHQIYEVDSLVDYVGVMRQGRLAVQMSRQELQRTVRNYRLTIPESWSAPADLTIARKNRSHSREVQCTLVGDEQYVTERLILSGAVVHDATPLTLEDAALAMLEGTRA